VEASNTPTIRRLTPSCRHQLPRIALKSKSRLEAENSGLRFKDKLASEMQRLKAIEEAMLALARSADFSDRS
jgi:hypothetical protein